MIFLHQRERYEGIYIHDGMTPVVYFLTIRRLSTCHLSLNLTATCNLLTGLRSYPERQAWNQDLMVHNCSTNGGIWYIKYSSQTISCKSVIHFLYKPRGISMTNSPAAGTDQKKFIRWRDHEPLLELMHNVRISPCSPSELTIFRS